MQEGIKKLIDTTSEISFLASLLPAFLILRWTINDP